MSADQRRMDERDARICQILQRNHHPVSMCPGCTNQQHAVALACLQGKTAITLPARLRQYVEISESFINHDRHVLACRPPIERRFSNIAASRLLDIGECAERIAISRLQS